ncbi:hypothetical protein [Streptomyces sp. C]|uniref:hypothetical protein n=1 Tax=Streptomyces sp. C TaxID=253839 RepID=UPI0001B53D51|nr:hypothetical protein [Streptomyces sp. C]EFL18922.1 predicted protein [Streptomyces sp. C]
MARPARRGLRGGGWTSCPRPEVQEPLARDDSRLNARLVQEEFARDHEENAARISAVLAGRTFGPARQPVPVLPGLSTSPEPVLATQALTAVRKADRVDPPMTRLDVRQSLVAASAIAHPGRFDLLEYVAAHRHVRYPYPQHHDVRVLFDRAARLRSAEELDEALTSRSA